MEKNLNNIEELFNDTPDFVFDNPDDIIDSAPLIINLDEINSEAKKMASLITERLADYYFDERYLKEHPYIPTKIANEMDNIRRLLKMLSVNEKAQDALISNITMNAGKGTLYSSLTSLQNSMLNIQTQLNTLTSNLESIFSEMQAECDRTFAEKEKEIGDDGSLTTRGAKELIAALNARLYNDNKINLENVGNDLVDVQTGEII